MGKAVIIDGKSVFYRGYYAMGNLAKKDGTPTSGIYGFAVIAMEIVKKINPEKIVVAWDKAKTSTAKRSKIYPEYKAGRVKPPEDFYTQIPLLKELILALGWGFFECDEYEADDIIGTLGKQATDWNVQNAGSEAEKLEVIIISSDLDMLQVVNENVKMYRVLKGFSEIEEMDVAAIEEKYGILKNQFLDLKALKGDASDNIPGVAGIGEKTAVKLLNEYGSLTGVYENLNLIRGSVKQKLEAGRESAEMSYALAQIMTDAPVNWEMVPNLNSDSGKIRKALEDLEFFSLIKKYSKELKLEKRKEQKAELRKLPDDLIVEWDVKRKMHEDSEIRRQILEGKEFRDLGQGKFLLDPLSRGNNESGQLGFELNMEDEKIQEYYRQEEEYKKFESLKKILLEYDLPLVSILFKMEEAGVLIDLEYFRELKNEFERRIKEIEEKIFDLAGGSFNINSPVQLSEVLFGKLNLPVKNIKKNNRGYSTGVKELEKLRKLHPIIEMIMDYREVAKLLSTYIIPLPSLADSEGRIHTTFTQNVTATGRLSSLAPNLQNIPVRTDEGKRIRKGFIAGPGKVLVSADYAQFELRLAAVLAGDQKLVEDFNQGVDIHTKTAAEVFGIEMNEVTKAQRRMAKVINFGVMYGISAKGLADATEMDVMTAKKFIDDYFKLRQPIREFLDKTLVQAREFGYVETFYGRRRPTPDVKSANYLIRVAAERAAENMPIQGTEADLMKRAMINLDKVLPDGAKLILQIHDSLIVECDEDQAEEVSRVMKKVMENVAPELAVKLEVEVSVGKNWGEL